MLNESVPPVQQCMAPLRLSGDACLSVCLVYLCLDRSIYPTAHLFFYVAVCLFVYLCMSVCQTELQFISTLTNL